MSYVFNSKFGSKSHVLVEISNIEQLRFVKCEDKSYKYVSDVTLLFNSERIINEIGLDSYNKLVRGIVPSQSSYSDCNFTDAQLFKHLKSRYIQSPAEVQSYFDSLVAEAKSTKKDIDKLKKLESDLLVEEKAKELASQQQQQQSKTD